MTTLNNRLQLALLNRERGKNALAKGFTLVELMIVIVIVGILSAVALPNFLNQTKKARATEGQSAISAAFKNAQQTYLESPSTIGSSLCASAGCTGSVPTAGTKATAAANTCASDLGFGTPASGANIEAVLCNVTSTTLSIQVTTPDGTVDGAIDLSDGSVTTKPSFTESSS